MRPSNRPGTIGRALGIGTRLVTERILPPPPPPRSAAEERAASEARVRRGETVGRTTRNVGRGSREFGRAVWNPFAQASSILWLEITGLFFAMFALLFAQHLWTIRSDYRAGAEHNHFLVYAGFTLLFLYFALTSFAKARARARKNAKQR